MDRDSGAVDRDARRAGRRWRLVAPEGRPADIVAGHDFMTPGFERHLSSWVDPASTDITASAATRLRTYAADSAT